MGALFFAPMFCCRSGPEQIWSQLGIRAVLWRIGGRRVVGSRYGEMSKNVSITASIYL
jgi:hypothetical protein